VAEEGSPEEGVRRLELCTLTTRFPTANGLCRQLTQFVKKIERVQPCVVSIAEFNRVGVVTDG